MSSLANLRPRYSAPIGLVRVVVVTILLTLLAFCIALFFGIVGIILTKMIRGTATPDMSIAYRHIALPIAAAVLVITLVVSLISEMRAYRLQRTRNRRSASRTRAA